MPQAMSQEHGHNLQTVQMLLKKNQVSEFVLKKMGCVFVFMHIYFLTLFS